MMKEQLIVFAGRIDPVKGMEILTEAFAGLVDDYPEVRLIVAGDGNYNNVLSRATPYWSKVIFTGFVDKTILYELFSICDIGVLPSLHEEFGFVALEMMMIGLPLIVGQTTGLAELVINGETGITVSLNSDEKDKEANVHVLRTAIKSLLDSPLLGKKYANSGRKRFLQNYSFGQFEQRIKEHYESCAHP